MYFIESNSKNAFFNIAMEEYFVKQKNEDYIISYINNPSVIIGKHQNAYSEVNIKFVNALKIPVLRRISGGGSVYHDSGNLNFCFIQNNFDAQKVNFAEKSSPIVDFFKTINLNAELGSKNELRVNGYKVSGSAEHVYKNRVLHHGTLLFNSNLDILDKSLQGSNQNYTDKSIPSNKTNVININTLLSENKTIEQFTDEFNSFILNYFNATKYCLTEVDENEINRLVDEKFNTWEWNYGYSPNYKYMGDVNTVFGLKTIELEVEKGIIKLIKCQNDKELSDELSLFFIGKQHRFDLLFDEVADENLLSLYYQLF